MKLPSEELGRCLVFEANLIDFLTLMTNNISLFINNYWDQMSKYGYLQRTFAHFFAFMRDVLGNIEDEPIKELYHSLSSTFIPQTLFFLEINTEMRDTEKTTKEEMLMYQMKVWTDRHSMSSICL